VKTSNLIIPDWPAPPSVRALSTTRPGGVSEGPWASFNLGLSCGDEQAHVLANRGRLNALLPNDPNWLQQVHGREALEVEERGAALPADAQLTSVPGLPLAVMSADCLPILLCDEKGQRVAAVHAGWRGLAGGVIEAALQRMNLAPERLLAWLGPAISGSAYEVGSEVREAFLKSASIAQYGTDRIFTPHGDRWLLDLAGAARGVLESLGVSGVYGGGFCTYGEPERFFSHRRDGVTGRMASVIWVVESEAR
jgi:YfiH family protein